MKVDAPYMKNILSLDYETATNVVWGVICFLILLTLLFLSTLPFRQSNSKAHTLYEISYIALIMPLIFPHQMKYAFYFLLPAVCCLMKLIVIQYKQGNMSIQTKATFAAMLVSFILCTMTTDLILGMHYSVVTQYFKTITIGTLLLIPFLIINKESYLKLK